MWLYFLCASFFTNVMFLNMIIAIMGDTYSRITENKSKYALQERTHLFAENLYLIRLNKSLSKFRYLYIITPN